MIQVLPKQEQFSSAARRGFVVVVVICASLSTLAGCASDTRLLNMTSDRSAQSLSVRSSATASIGAEDRSPVIRLQDSGPGGGWSGLSNEPHLIPQEKQLNPGMQRASYPVSPDDNSSQLGGYGQLTSSPGGMARPNRNSGAKIRLKRPTVEFSGDRDRSDPLVLPGRNQNASASDNRGAVDSHAKKSDEGRSVRPFSSSEPHVGSDPDLNMHELISETHSAPAEPGDAENSGTEPLITESATMIPAAEEQNSGNEDPVSANDETEGNDTGSAVTKGAGGEAGSNGLPGSGTADREPTMLDRLRVLYTPRREENPGEAIRKQFRRLPSPWGLLREREAEPTVIPEQSADASPFPGVQGPPSEPGAVSPSSEMSSGLSTVIQQLEQTLNSWPRDSEGYPTDPDEWRRRQTDLRLLYLVADRSSDAVSAIESLPPEEQEFWQSLMLAMTYYRSTPQSGSSREELMASTGDQLKAAGRHASTLSVLSIRRVAFCSAINSFGNIDGFPSADFNPGQPVLIYAEIENFRAERTAEGTWRSDFSADLHICRNDETVPIESIRIGEIIDESTTPRMDYFQSYELTIPQLAKGHYTARISLRDKNSLQRASAALEFNIR